MTGRGPSQAVHPKAGPDAPRRAAAPGPSPEAPRPIDGQARAVESAGPEAMALIATIPDARAGAIAAMPLPEGKGRETIARRMRHGRSGPAERPRRFPRGRMQSRP